MQYVGQTKRALKTRFKEHLLKIKQAKKIDTFLYQHFWSTGHSRSSSKVLVQPVEKIIHKSNSTERLRNILRHELELKLSKRLQTPFPLGFNDIYHGGNSPKMPDFDAFSILDIKKRNKRSHGKRKKGNFKRKQTVLSLFDLNILLNSGRHQMFSKLASLSVSSLRKLDDEANKFYDRKHNLYEAALLTGCYNMLFVLTLILKLTTLDTSSKFHSLIKVLNS